MVLLDMEALSLQGRVESEETLGMWVITVCEEAIEVQRYSKVTHAPNQVPRVMAF